MKYCLFLVIITLHLNTLIFDHPNSISNNKVQLDPCKTYHLKYDTINQMIDDTFINSRWFLSELGIPIGISNSKISYPDPIYAGITITLQFRSDGFLASKIEMKDGFIKYNNSWAGSWNTKTLYHYNEANCLMSIQEFDSHTRWFRKLTRLTTFTYDSNFVIKEVLTYNRKGDIIHQKNKKWTSFRN